MVGRWIVCVISLKRILAGRYSSCRGDIVTSFFRLQTRKDEKTKDYRNFVLLPSPRITICLFVLSERRRKDEVTRICLSYVFSRQRRKYTMYEVTLFFVFSSFRFHNERMKWHKLATKGRRYDWTKLRRYSITIGTFLQEEGYVVRGLQHCQSPFSVINPNIANATLDPVESLKTPFLLLLNLQSQFRPHCRITVTTCILDLSFATHSFTI